jgi:predicted short-subunit dehydrogenase-like oxidoreductase (DUF2520 family)
MEGEQGTVNIGSFGFIGAGKVGTALGKYLAERGRTVAGYFSAHRDNAAAAARFTDSADYGSAGELAAHSDVIFVTVPDGAIKDVWDVLKKTDISKKYICHCSGALSSRVFDGIAELGASALSVHPLAAVNNKWDSHKYMHLISFTVEGEETAAENMRAFFRSLGNPAEIIVDDKKAIYHAGAVYMTNFVVALVHAGTELLSSCGPDREFIREASKRLFFANAENIYATDAVQALTGPVERGDAGTVKNHLACLDEPLRGLYAALSKELLRIAKVKHPSRDYGALERELNK